MSTARVVNGDPLTWLLSPDASEPGPRLLALTGLLGRQADDREVRAARQAVMETGPVPAILDAQWPEGYWVKPGAGYGPKYRSSAWCVIFLAQLGADGSDPRVRAAGEYMLEHTRSSYGGFTMADNLSPAMMVQCHQGNLCAALLDLGWLGDSRLDTALDWLARSVTGEGIAPPEQAKTSPRYYRSGNCGPGFGCSAQNYRPCAWGAIKVMLALGKVPPDKRTRPMTEAIAAGVELLLGRDPAVADYPTPLDTKPNRSWFKFGYPIGYVTDVLQNLEALAALGYGRDPRLARATDLVLSKQDAAGRWKMEYTYNGKTWADVETPGAPSKWVTLRALRVLKAAGVWPPAGS